MYWHSCIIPVSQFYFSPDCSAGHCIYSEMKVYIIFAAASRDVVQMRKQVDICQLYSLTKGYDQCATFPKDQAWLGVDLCTRQDMLTFFLQCLFSSSSCRNNASLRYNVLGALGTGSFRPWKFYGSADLSYRGDFCKYTFRWHTRRVNPFRTSLMFLK